MIVLEVRGLDKALRRLGRMKRNLAQLQANAVFGPGIRKVQRFVADISPVQTGAYQLSHRVVIGTDRASVSIDPGARNPLSGVAVTRYATSVEERHSVYGRGGEYAEIIAHGISEKIAVEVLK